MHVSRMFDWGFYSILLLFANLGLRAQSSIELNLNSHYLHFPVSHDEAYETRLQLVIEGEVIREMDIWLPDSDPDFWTYLDISAYEGKQAQLKTSAGEEKKGLSLVYQSNDRTYLTNVYQEDLRPQVHFSSIRGWNNDPNGLVYYEGEYHLFFQHNPYGFEWGNMHWGHAVSRDLVHWEQLPEALYPDKVGVAYSGSAVIDYQNTSGFQTGDKPPMVAIYTSTLIPSEQEEEASGSWMERQSIAYSNDRGRTWTKYEGNPVIGDRRAKLGTINDRDPNVFWHEPTKKWVMILFERIGLSIFTSDNLKEWIEESHFETFWECPELIELPVDGDSSNTKWVVYGAGGYYMIGSFDGKQFTPEYGPYAYIDGDFFAAQTYENIPEEDGRQIQIGWGVIPSPGMPFNMMMTFPTELSLRTTNDGVRLFNEPVRELELLYTNSYSWENLTPQEANKKMEGISSKQLHVKCVIENEKAMDHGFWFGGDELTYTIRTNEFIFNDEAMVFRYLPELGSNTLSYEIILDKTSIEIFVDNGRYTLVLPRKLETEDYSMRIFPNEDDDSVKIHALEVHELNSIWTESTIRN